MMNAQERRDRVGNRLMAAALLAAAAILAYVFWPAEPLSSLMEKLSAIVAAVLLIGAIVMAALIW